MKKTIRQLWISVLLSLGFLFSCLTVSAEVQFKKQKIKVGTKIITVEVAETNGQLSKGLMFRKAMPANEGMLFVFPDLDTRSFWMKNTFIPLSIGFFDQSQTLVDIQDMSPVKSEMEISPPSYISRKPAKFALEMNQGWFVKNKVKVGDKFERLKPVKVN